MGAWQICLVVLSARNNVGRVEIQQRFRHNSCHQAPTIGKALLLMTFPRGFAPPLPTDCRRHIRCHIRISEPLVQAPTRRKPCRRPPSRCGVSYSRSLVVFLHTHYFNMRETFPLITLTMHDAHHYRMSTRVLGGLTHEFFERMLKAQHNMNPSTDHPAVLDGVDAFGLLFPWAWNLQRPRKGI